MCEKTYLLDIEEFKNIYYILFADVEDIVRKKMILKMSRSIIDLITFHTIFCIAFYHLF